MDTFAGWVFINSDPFAMPLEQYLDPIWQHYAPYAWEQSYLGVHVGKVLEGNWKSAAGRRPTTPGTAARILCESCRLPGSPVPICESSSGCR